MSSLMRRVGPFCLVFTMVTTIYILFPTTYRSRPTRSREQHVIQNPCTQSHYTKYQIAQGPIQFSSSPLGSLAAPKIAPLNATAGEQWAFDGTSDSGRSGFLMGFYRDPTYAFLGPGSFRLSLDVVWDDGKTWSLVDYLDNSTIIECGGWTKGIWSKPGHVYTFELSADNSSGTVTFLTPAVQGHFALRATAPARYPDGSVAPNDAAATFNAPSLHWVELFSAASVTVDMNIESKPFRWTGMGGAEHWWSGESWLRIMQGWTAMRAKVGPYSFSYWGATSRIQKGVLYPSAFLAKDGLKIFATQNKTRRTSGNLGAHGSLGQHVDGQHADAQDHGSIQYHQRHATPGLASEAHSKYPSEYEIRFRDPGSQKEWAFYLKPRNLEFEFELGRGKGGGHAFVGTASGGEVGVDRANEYSGVFFHEQVDIADLVVPWIYEFVARWYHRIKALLFG